MGPIKKSILTINGGSSSIKFSLYKTGQYLGQLLTGEVEGIGSKNTKLNFHDFISNQKSSVPLQIANHDDAINFLVNWLEKQECFSNVKAIGHRIVQGMKHTRPELITDELLGELKKFSVYDPEHLPDELKLIEAFRNRYPALPQIACFDTAFHTSMPDVAKLLPVPRRYYNAGIQRYGFHGLSYTYLMEELKQLSGIEATQGKVILAHLGNGASITAVREGKSIDTSMSFTPTGGLPMSTRTGDLDPGVALYLMRTENIKPDQFSNLINHQSGLLGISETSSDMRDLLKVQNTDKRAAEAIDLFCYQAKKYIGAYAAVLGGIDTLVFSGGIGENAPEIRHRICNGLEFLGIELNESSNQINEPIISNDRSKVTVRVIKTNEELMIAKLVCQVLNYNIKN